MNFGHNHPWHWRKLGTDFGYCNTVRFQRRDTNSKTLFFCYLYAASLFFIWFWWHFCSAFLKNISSNKCNYIVFQIFTFFLFFFQFWCSVLKNDHLNELLMGHTNNLIISYKKGSKFQNLPYLEGIYHSIFMQFCYWNWLPKASVSMST